MSENQEGKCKVISYVMNFGKEINQELIDWVDANFNFDNLYKT